MSARELRLRFGKPRCICGVPSCAGFCPAGRALKATQEKMRVLEEERLSKAEKDELRRTDD